MTARLTADTILNGGFRHPGLVPLFIAWSSRRPRLAAMWQTTAVLGSVGCGLLHVTAAGQAIGIFVASWMLAPLPLVPWFVADYRINRGWRR